MKMKFLNKINIGHANLNYYIFRTKINTEIFTRGLRNLLQVNVLSSIFISKSV